MIVRILALLAALPILTLPVSAQDSGPLRIEITEGVIEPLPFATPDFVSDNAAGASFGKQIADVATPHSD